MRMEQTVRVLAISAVSLLLILTSVVAYDTWGWVGRTISGIPLLENGVVSLRLYVPQRHHENLGTIEPEDRVVMVNGLSLSTGRAVAEAVASLAPDTPVRYRFMRPSGVSYDVEVPTTRFKRADYMTIVVPFIGGALLLLLVGLVPVVFRPDLLGARLIFLSAFGAAATYHLLAFDMFYTYRLSPWIRLPGLFAAATTFHLAFVFPERRPPFRAGGHLAPLVLYGCVALLSVAFLAAFHDAPFVTHAVDFTDVALRGLGALLLGVNLLATVGYSKDPRARQQALVTLPSPLFGALTLVAFLVDGSRFFESGLPPALYMVPVIAIACLIVYAVVKENVFEFDAVVRQGLIFGILVLAAVATYVAIFVVVHQWLGATTAWLASVVAAAVLIVMVPAVPPLRRRIEMLVEQFLFPNQRRARSIVHAASRELARLRDQEGLARFLRETASESLRSASLRVVAGRPGEALHEIAPVRSDAGLVIGALETLYTPLQQGRTLNLDARGERGGRAGLPKPVRQKLIALGCPLVVALPPSTSLIGGFLLGARTDGRLYTHDDEELGETLAAQAAVAIENARVWEEVRSLERRLAAENVYLRQEIDSAHGITEIVGASAAIRSVIAQIQQVAPTDASVLVQGETGTGKELVVRALHSLSRRRDRVLVKIACAALPEALLESELFGYEKGAFTGAGDRKPGRFELADGGTIFFDDVDTLPLGVQAKLLRALQEGEVQRLGSNDVRHVDVRVVAASNRDLLAEVRAGRFREDLYYRLNVVPLRIPPLRERSEDVPLLVEHFVRQQSTKLGREIRGIAAEAFTELKAYSWPGNVRELGNVIERAIVLGSDDVLRLPAPLLPGRAEAPVAGAALAIEPVGSAPLAELLRRYKTTLITNALGMSGGNHRQAAELLGLHRSSLTRMIHELGLDVPSVALAAPSNPKPIAKD